MTYICAPRNLPISDALQMQIEVQRRLHEQLEVSYTVLCGFTLFKAAISAGNNSIWNFCSYICSNKTNQDESGSLPHENDITNYHKMCVVHLSLHRNNLQNYTQTCRTHINQ